VGTTKICAVCGTGVQGRSDTLYCSSACRQKAFRTRAAARFTAALAASPDGADPTVSDPVSRAQRARAVARETRDAAAGFRTVIGGIAHRLSQITDKVAATLMSSRPSGGFDGSEQ